MPQANEALKYAYDAGYAAYLAGLNESDNPYPAPAVPTDFARTATRDIANPHDAYLRGFDTAQADLLSFNAQLDNAGY
jgi:hypothetical protein